MKTAKQMLIEIKKSDSEHITYGEGDLGVPILRTEAVTDILAMDNETIGDGTWYECDENGNLT